MTCKVTKNKEGNFVPKCCNVVRDLAFQVPYKEKENGEEKEVNCIYIIEQQTKSTFLIVGI
jgi:hypothetical protein